MCICFGKERVMKRQIKRGDVYDAILPKQKGSIQAGRRPVIVTQTNRLNGTSTNVIVVPITSKIKNPGMDWHYVLPMVKGLSKQSMVLGEHRVTIDMSELVKYRCTLDKDIMKNVTRAIRAAEAEDRFD